MASPQTRLPIQVRDGWQALRRRWRWIATSAVVAGAIGLVYAATRSPVWEATQATVLRDEAIGDLTRQGRFESADALKTAQETVLQVARQREALAAALADVGPPPSFFRFGEYPSEAEVEAFAEQVDVAAPKGLEFGKSEVMYVKTQAADAKRATELVVALCGRIDEHLRDLRRERARGVIAEMEQTVQMAGGELRAATDELRTVEGQVGSDLGELRVLNESGAGESNLRTSLNQIRAEIRTMESDQTGKQELRKILEAAKSDAGKLVATPNRLLESQPGIRRIKDGLVDAQLRRAALVGKLNPGHPELLAAIAAENEVRQNLYREVDGAVQGLDAEGRVAEASLDNLRRQQAEVESRLSKLAGMRATYGNLVAVVRQKNDAFQAAETKLADARASFAAAESAGLLTKMGPAVPSDGPVGPSKSQIVLAAFLLGGLGCAGLIVLMTPLERIRGRRATDFLPPHLRPAERNTGRRGADRNVDPELFAAASAVATRPPADPAPQPSQSRARRATDPQETHQGRDRRTGDRRANAAQSSPVVEPTKNSAPQQTSDVAPAEVKPPTSPVAVRPAADEVRETSAVLDNLRKQIDLLRETNVRPTPSDTSDGRTVER